MKIRSIDRRSSRTRRGFTLLEMMMVVVLIGILAGVAVVSLSGVAERGRIDTTKAAMQQIKNALVTYNAQNGTFPDTLDALATPPALIEKNRLQDAWKQKYIYRFPSNGNDPERPFDLISLAGKPMGAPENINVWTMDGNQTPRP
jgi:general secretion pathway protein G